MVRQAQSFFSKIIPAHRALQDDIAERIESERWAKDAVADKLSEMGVENLSKDDFESYAHEAATVYTLKTLFLKVAEDKRFMRRAHVHKVRQRATVYHELFDSIAKNMTWGEYLEYAFRDIAYKDIAFDLFKETPYELVPPSDGLAQKLLTAVDELGDLSAIETALIGDLYEHLMDETERKRLGYYTTPDFIIEFLLDKTLEPAFDDWHFSDIRYLDPACGTGHFLVRAYRRFLQRYRDDNSMTELEIFKRVMENNIFGIDVSEFAARITLFRLMLEGLDAKNRDAKRGHMQEYPDVSFNVFVANSLIRLPSEEEGMLPGIDKPLKYEEDSIARYYKKEISHLKVDLADALNHKFHVINANPPYVRVQRNVESVSIPNADGSWEQMDYLEYLRENYDSAYYNFDLSVPFLERSIDLLTTEGKGGYLGFITTGKFAKQNYGKKLIEVLNSKAQLKVIADLTDAKVFDAGAYPMLLVLQRKNHPDLNADVEIMATYQPKESRQETWKHIATVLEA
ncbi:MAG: Eco57I restriction-modification methylase domain-containing protein [bacterium]